MQFLFTIFILSCLIQYGFYLLIYARLIRVKSTSLPTAHKDIPISVIICARNEAANLLQNLPKILEQDYAKFEVLVVNDGSTDESSEILNFFLTKYPHRLRILNISDSTQRLRGKKHALAKGIKAAQYHHLLLTDADCQPESNLWISYMANHFKTGKQIILGYGPYEVKRSLLNLFIQYETVHTALQYLSFALWGMPYMGVGRNLAYHRSMFKQVNGFEKHKHIISGDDDLFINEVATTTNTTIEINPKSFCVSAPPTTWRRWYRQKTRHLSTGKHYRKSIQFMLALQAITHLLVYGILIALLVMNYQIYTTILFFSIRTLIQLTIYFFVLKYLNRRYLIFWIPILDALQLLYYCIFSSAIFLNKPTILWKDNKHL